jgi:flagellar biosynthesis GTPase FlhF
VDVTSFIVQSAADAVEQIHRHLGPDAHIVGIRKVPATGLLRLWKKYGRIEVLAGVPDAAEGEPGPAGEDRDTGLMPLPRIPSPSSPTTPESDPAPAALPDFPVFPHREATRPHAAVLDKMGLLPVFAERVLDRAEAIRMTQSPASLAEELDLLRTALHGFWRPAPAVESETEGVHVFIGPPGSGKTTVLSKWLTQTVLVQAREARVWRLDSARANTAESLSIHCAILGVPEHRTWEKGTDAAPGARWFVDLPGVAYHDRASVAELGELLGQFSNPAVHLVLNAAYDIPLLLAQVGALAHLPVCDLILTHLDEETRWSKLWNLVLGTNYSLRFLSAGQNIPSQFFLATPALLSGRTLPHQTPDLAQLAGNQGEWQRSC